MQRGSVLPLLLIFGLVIAIGIGVFFIQFSRTNTSSEASILLQSSKIMPSPSPKNQAVFDEFTGLKFEISEGFSVKRETEEEYFTRALGNSRKNFTGYVLYPPAEFTEAFYIISDAEKNLDKAVIAVWVFQNSEALTPKAFYDKYWYYPFVWGDFTGRKVEIAPETAEVVGGKEGLSGIVSYREGKPKYIYLPLIDKKLMMQIQLPTVGNAIGQGILRSFKFE